MPLSPRMVYQQGDHVCSLFSDPDEQLATAVEYIRGGLQRGERCLYVCCDHTIDEFRAALKTAGIDVETHEANKALLLKTKHEGHLSGGSFDPDAMINMLEIAVRDALADGFKGLCAAGDMTWVLDGAPGTHRLAEYEARLNHFYSSHRALGLCQYNRRSLPAETLDHGIATHSSVRIDGPIVLANPFYEAPDAAAHRTADPASLDRKVQAIRNLMH